MGCAGVIQTDLILDLVFRSTPASFVFVWGFFLLQMGCYDHMLVVYSGIPDVQLGCLFPLKVQTTSGG